MNFKSQNKFYKSKAFYSIAALVAILAIVGIIVLSSNDSDKKTTTSTTTTTTTTAKKKIVLAPLTGLPDESGQSNTRPALAVKIGNNPEARPQAGITEADIMYEEIVEGGITRYMAIFNSNVPERVGPVRSVRGMDPNITLNWGGVFAYSGGAAKNETKIKSTKGILALNETAAGSGMKRDSSRSAPNNLYALPSVLFQKNATPVPPKAQFVYSKTAPTSAETAASFVVGFQSGFACTWTYDSATGKFMRSYGTKPVVDQKSKQVGVANVVVQFINYPSESEGITTGSGDVWVFRNGKVVKGKWERPSTDSPAKFTDAQGKIISLNPGQTWVELASTTTAVTVTP
ncbi:MAG: DUF3048 domain-containing protein [Acidimicrobiia bacterium]